MGMAGKERETQGEHGQGEMQAETGVMLPPARGHPGRQKLGGAESRSPSAFRGSMVLPTPQFQTSSF